MKRQLHPRIGLAAMLVAALLLHPCYSPAEPLPAITFSEFPVNTAIYDQYLDHGILFSGDNPFITTDGSSPTSPILSGTPRFFGRITGTFVNPENPAQISPVSGFSFTSGYFDSIGSVRIEWFDKDGNKLGQRSNTKYAIEGFEIADAGPIASWSIGIFADEPAGYGIDNFVIEPLGPSLIFREKKEAKGEGFWFLLGDEIPGYDHVGFQIDDLVYESYPSYSPGTYRTAKDNQTSQITSINGVQAQFNTATFKHDSKTKSTKVIQTDELPINRTLAESMRTYMQGRINSGATFRLLDFNSLEGITATMSPYAQKGGSDNAFTCVGLVEAAAEAAGHNDGQGFIPNGLESISANGKIFPLLSPQLLNYTLKTSAAIESVKQWFQGFFDPVDFLITDPIGRRLGHAPSIGTIREIPGAFFSGDGSFEQVLIPNPLPGNYTLQLYGRSKPVNVAYSNISQSQSIQLPILKRNASQTEFIPVPAVQSSRGDINNDGAVNTTDLNLLGSQSKVFTNGPDDPRDINGDGIISTSDYIALERLLFPPDGSIPFNGVITQMIGKFGTKPPKTKKITGKDLFYFSIGSEYWAATDNLGNESTGTWARMNKKGTIIRLTYADTTSLESQIISSLKTAYGHSDFQFDLASAPLITIVKTNKKRYKAVLQARYLILLPGDKKPRKGTYSSNLFL